VSLNPSDLFAMQAKQQWGKPLYLHSLLSYHEIEFMVFAKNYLPKASCSFVLSSATSFSHFFFILLSLPWSLLNFHYCSAVTTKSEVNNSNLPW
jgi:hypothetical protein